ncbi:ferritin heavy chain-like [Rattus rattus]|uniref:ferritin heavy chain-like n=1 Tax=Rattus rattus TaxID=10117 RepID=UPI0013F351A2|nr:ferritin heavy chain-like [Rattus rattus]
MFSCRPFSQECTDALNRVVAYHLHTSHVYLAMAYSFRNGKRIPPFVEYFETLANTRREDADAFLKHLWKRNAAICPPTFEKVDMMAITTPIEAILLAQEMERTLTSILVGLQGAARRESDLLRLLTSVLRKQRKNEDDMKTQLTFHQRVEKEREMQVQTKKPSTVSGLRGFVTSDC